jgi:hypothetical protein
MLPTFSSMSHQGVRYLCCSNNIMIRRMVLQMKISVSFSTRLFFYNSRFPKLHDKQTQRSIHSSSVMLTKYWYDITVSCKYCLNNYDKSVSVIYLMILIKLYTAHSALVCYIERHKFAKIHPQVNV